MGGRGHVRPDEPRPPRRDACKSLQIHTNLMSPKEPIKTVNVGDILQVKIAGGSSERYVVAATASGETVGTVGSDKAIDLIDCIDKGYVYCADVLSIEEGACRVLVHVKDR
jgi:hypothetical protein